jgi:hypothetical protein
MDFRSPSRIPSASGPRCRVGPRRPSLRHVPSPVGFVAPPALPARGIHFPAWCVPPVSLRRLSPPPVLRSCRRGSRRDGSTVPRRGVPTPLRSASAVSHDLDGLLLPGPCGVFRPHTPMGSGVPVPRSVPVHAGPRAVASRRGGRAFCTRRSRSVPCGRRARPRPCRRPRWNHRFGRSRSRSGVRTPSCVRLARPRPATRLPECPSADRAPRGYVAWLSPAPGVAILALSRPFVRVLPRPTTGPARGRIVPSPRERVLIPIRVRSRPVHLSVVVPFTSAGFVLPAVRRLRPGGRVGLGSRGCRPRGLV